MFLRRRQARAHARGQAMAEFALVLPLALLILFGIIQFGFLFAAQIGMVNALRETTRFASTSAVSDSSQAAFTAAAVCDYLEDQSLDKMPGFESAFLVKGGATNVAYSYYTDPHDSPVTYSVRVAVNAEYRHLLLVPLVNVILDGLDGSSDGRFKLGASEAMRVENPLLTTPPTGFPLSSVNC